MPKKPYSQARAISNHHDLGVEGQGHLRSNVKMGIESLYMVSYLLVIVTTCLEATIEDIQQFEIIYNAFPMRKVKVSCDLYRGHTDLSFVQHVDLW